MESEPEATQSPKDKRVGWSELSVYNEDAPRQLLSSLAALGEVMPAPPEQQAFKKEKKQLYIADFFIQKLNSSHMKTKPAIERISCFVSFPRTYICMSSLRLLDPLGNEMSLNSSISQPADQNV